MASSDNSVSLTEAISWETWVKYTTNLQFAYWTGTWWKMIITGDSITDAPSYTGFNSSSTDSCGITSDTGLDCGINKNFIILVK
jgi:hypothetical protein